MKRLQGIAAAIAFALALLLVVPAFAQKTFTELGCKPNNPEHGAENSRLLNAALVERKGGSYKVAKPGAWYFSAPIQVSAGYGARFYSDVTGQWRYLSDDLVRFIPTEDFPANRCLIEYGGPAAPNGSFRQQARGCEVQRIGFNCHERPDVGGVAFFQCEQSRVISCQFYKCWRGVLIQSKDKRWNMNHLVESCQFKDCAIGVSIVGEGSGQTFGGTEVHSCIIQRCDIGINMKFGNVPTLFQSVYIQNCKHHGIYMTGSKATLLSGYFENPINDIALRQASTLYCEGWNKIRKMKADGTSEFVGDIPDPK